MRIRLAFFLTTLLLFVTLSSTILDNFIVNQERESFVDKELGDALAAFDLSDIERLVDADPASSDDLISRKFGHLRVGKFFIVKDLAGKILFESKAATLLEAGNIPSTPAHLTLEINGKYVRVASRQLDPTHVVQAGFFAERELMLIPLLSLLDIVECLILTALGLVAAFALAKKLLSPLRELSAQVAQLSAASTVPEISLGKSSRYLNVEFSQDELALLVRGLNSLIGRVNRSIDLLRACSHQMAHELKTPMAVLSTEVEVAEADGLLPPARAEKFRQEVLSASDTVSSFLLWAEIEAAGSPPGLHVTKVSDTWARLAPRVRAVYHCEVAADFADASTFALNPTYLEIVLWNLVSNAIRYSRDPGSVKIHGAGSVVTITNAGAPIPEDVLRRMGQPFNRGEGPRGEGAYRSHGLGLATVAAICRSSGWRLNFGHEAGITSVEVDLAASATR